MLLRIREALEAHYAPEFWEQIHRKLTYLHGTPVLTRGARTSTPANDVVGFLLECSDDHFLDFLELIFQVSGLPTDRDGPLVRDINEFFDVDDLPYALTDFVWEPTKVLRRLRESKQDG